MLHLPLLRSITTLLSLGLVVAGAYLVWSWREGQWITDPTGDLLRVREDWRLWLGLVALGWSLAGRWLAPLLLARRDDEPTRPERTGGRMRESATGSQLYVETHGRAEAQPIILTHGWGMDSTFWNYAKADLSKRFRVIAWDLPGLGRSKALAPQAITLSAFAGDLADLVDMCGHRRPVLVGHSIGGMIIQTMLAERPEMRRRIAGVVLLNTTYTNPLKTMIFSRLMLALQKPVLEPGARLTILLHPLAWLMQWQSYQSGLAHMAHRLGFGRYVTRSQLEHVTRLAARNPPAALARGTLAMFDWDATEAMKSVHVPTLVVAGELDIVTKLEANARIADEAPAGTFEVVEGVNHLGPMERADVYNRLIANFALTLGAPAGGDRHAPRKPLEAEVVPFPGVAVTPTADPS
ncbi:MAG TPA: alpha/beta hydrolase [Caulobacteraceae bacterium]|nr:alpha/beta hydrolase [Caulobacteraceae bacterium]